MPCNFLLQQFTTCKNMAYYSFKCILLQEVNKGIITPFNAQVFKHDLIP